MLRRSGWAKEQFPVGSPVTVEAAPDKVDPNSCYLNTIRFKDGTHMDRYGQYVKGTGGSLTEVRGPVATADAAKREARRPTGEPNISGDWADEQLVMANPRGTGGGLVRGAGTAGVDSFLGLPYAAPPTGNLRWRAPRPCCCKPIRA